MAIENSNPVFSDRLCACGCGRQTRLIRDRPSLFVRGHNATMKEMREALRQRSARSFGVKRKANVKGYRRLERDYVHRARAERALGRPLPPRAVVHHADGSKDHTAPLVICEDTAYHRLLHARMRIKAAGGNPNTDKVCTTCGQAKPRADFTPDPSGYLGVSCYCLSCMAAKRRKQRAITYHDQRMLRAARIDPKG